jgi:hypothetical protein
VVASLPCPTEGWTWLRRLRVWDVVRGAYGCRVESEGELDPAQRYIFAYHPHGEAPGGAAFLGGAMSLAAIESVQLRDDRGKKAGAMRDA